MPEPRDASTVILARRGAEGAYEVLLTKRPETMRFMGGTYVFPGGALDEGDCSDALAERSALGRDEARERLGEDLQPDRALGLHVCALRELFEEVGVLVARKADGRMVDPAAVRSRWAPRQEELAHDPEAFCAFLTSEDLVLATDLLVRHGRLVTPEMSPVRFDARFFVVPHPDGQAVFADPVEVPEHTWVAPPEAIRRASEADLNIPIPTMSILQGLAEVPGFEQVTKGQVVRREVHAAALSPLVAHVLAPNPGLATGAGTNTYIIGKGEVAIVDPAVPDPIYIETLARTAGDRGRPSLILITHMHPDHTGGVAALREQMRCEVAAWEGARGATFEIDRKLADGDVVQIGGATLRVHYTPGHASHHVCFHLVEENALFAGDVVAGLGTVVIAPPDGNLADYMSTLERLREVGPERVYPGHGPMVADGVAKLTEYIDHRRDRERQVIEALQAGDDVIPAMVKRIYTDVPQALHPMAEMSVLAHLEMLVAEGRVRREDDRFTLAG